MGSTYYAWATLFAEMDAIDAQRAERRAQDNAEEWRVEANRLSGLLDRSRNQLEFAQRRFEKLNTVNKELNARLGKTSKELLSTKSVLMDTETKLSQAEQSNKLLTEDQRDLSRMTISLTVQNRILKHEFNVEPDKRIFAGWNEPSASSQLRETGGALQNDIARALHHVGDTADPGNYDLLVNRLFDAYMEAFSSHNSTDPNQGSELRGGAERFNLVPPGDRLNRIKKILEFPDFDAFRDVVKICPSVTEKGKPLGVNFSLPPSDFFSPHLELVQKYRPLFELQRHFFGYISIHMANSAYGGISAKSKILDVRGTYSTPEDVMHGIGYERYRAKTISHFILESEDEADAEVGFELDPVEGPEEAPSNS